MVNARCHVKKDDKVKIVVGKDKGKVGKVLRVVANNKIILEGVNKVKRHTKPSAQNKQGGIIDKEMPIDSSNVMLVCNKCLKTVRSLSRILKDGQKVRICRNCDEVI